MSFGAFQPVRSELNTIVVLGARHATVSSWAFSHLWDGSYQSRATSLIYGFDYSLTDRLNIEVSLPYVFTRYTGNPAFHAAPLDDGSTHSTFQDFRFDVHYNVMSHSHRTGLQDLAITPFISMIQPSHSYDFQGESAFGCDLREYALGIAAARDC